MRVQLLCWLLFLTATTYTSPDRTFILTVPPGYRVLTGKNKPSFAYIPVCHNESNVCIAYPRGRYPGTTFGDASLEVTVSPAADRQACPADDRPTTQHLIDGIEFMHSVDVAAAMSHDIQIVRYTGFRKGKCYVLAVQVTFTNFAVYPPGAIKEFTTRDQEQVTAQLTSILNSLIWLP